MPCWFMSHLLSKKFGTTYGWKEKNPGFNEFKCDPVRKFGIYWDEKDKDCLIR